MQMLEADPGSVFATPDGSPDHPCSDSQPVPPTGTLAGLCSNAASSKQEALIMDNIGQALSTSAQGKRQADFHPGRAAKF